MLIHVKFVTKYVRQKVELSECYKSQAHPDTRVEPSL